VIRTPIQAPNANAHAERWIRTLCANSLDRILILGRRHLDIRVHAGASTAGITTSIGRTARWNSCRPTAATRRL
jgi:hypothetical protein